MKEQPLGMNKHADEARIEQTGIDFGNPRITALMCHCHYQIVPFQDRNPCVSVKGTEINHSGNSFREQRLLYCMRATTYIVEPY